MKSMDQSLTIKLQKTIDFSRLNISGTNFKGTLYKSVDVSSRLEKFKSRINRQVQRTYDNSPVYANVPR